MGFNHKENLTEIVSHLSEEEIKEIDSQIPLLSASAKEIFYDCLDSYSHELSYPKARAAAYLTTRNIQSYRQTRIKLIERLKRLNHSGNGEFEKVLSSLKKISPREKHELVPYFIRCLYDEEIREALGVPLSSCNSSNPEVRRRARAAAYLLYSAEVSAHDEPAKQPA